MGIVSFCGLVSWQTAGRADIRINVPIVIPGFISINACKSMASIRSALQTIDFPRRFACKNCRLQVKSLWPHKRTPNSGHCPGSASQPPQTICQCAAALLIEHFVQEMIWQSCLPRFGPRPARACGANREFERDLPDLLRNEAFNVLPAMEDRLALAHFYTSK